MHALTRTPPPPPRGDADAPAATVRRARRVAIIDFDVHHGNGTQGIVEVQTSRGRASPLPLYNPHVRMDRARTRGTR